MLKAERFLSPQKILYSFSGRYVNILKPGAITARMVGRIMILIVISRGYTGKILPKVLRQHSLGLYNNPTQRQISPLPHEDPNIFKFRYKIVLPYTLRYSQWSLTCRIKLKLKNQICGLQLPGEPHRSTKLLQLAGRWQYDGIM